MKFDIFDRWSFTTLVLWGIGDLIIFAFLNLYFTFGQNYIIKSTEDGFPYLVMFCYCYFYYQMVGLVVIIYFLIREIKSSFRIQNPTLSKITNNTIYKYVACIAAYIEICLFLLIMILALNATN